MMMRKKVNQIVIVIKKSFKEKREKMEGKKKRFLTRYTRK